MRGPFSSRHVTRHILLGRILLTDELSTDRKAWRCVNNVTEMLPPELSDLSNWDNYQQLVVTRMLLDERKRERRAQQGESVNRAGPERRSGADRRRNNDSEFIIQHFLSRDFSYLANSAQSRRLRILLLTLLLATLLYAWLAPTQR
ncbi:MAG: hypothetical protein PVG72_01950 [Gammaproteobacteria bacterium]